MKSIAKIDKSDLANNIKDWLNGCVGISGARAVIVRIGSEGFAGGLYERKGIGQRVFYLVPGLTKKMQREVNRTAYRIDGDDRDWYVGSYIDRGDINKDNEQFHPFGACFQMFVWGHEGLEERIDESDEKKWKRVRIEVEDLG